MPEALRAPSVFLDPDRVPPTVQPAYLKALEAFHLTPLQARFAAHVMYLGGVFFASQASEWLGRNWPEFRDLAEPGARHSYCARFLQPLFASVGKLKPIAASFELPDCPRQYAHCNSRYFYGVVGLPHSRYQRIDRNALAAARLLNFDYIVRHPEYTWYGATEQKVALFEGLGVPRKLWPVRYYHPRVRGTAPAKPAYFPDHNPIGLGGWHLVFLIPVTYGTGPAGIRRMIDRTYSPLWRHLRRSGFRVSLVFSQRPGALLEVPRDFVLPPSEADHRLLVNAFLRYIYQLAMEMKDRRLLDAQGGAAEVVARHQQLTREARSAPEPRLGLMDIEVHDCPDLRTSLSSTPAA